MSLTREQIRRALGELDDIAIARIMASGATPEELAEAQAREWSDARLTIVERVRRTTVTL